MVDHRYIRHCLCKRHIDRSARIQPHIEFALCFPGRALFRAHTAACTQVFLYIPRFFADIHRKVTHKAGYLFHLAVGIQMYFFMLCSVHHFRREDAGCTVERWKRLVELRHFSANSRRLFDNIYLVTCVCNIERRLNARNTAADHERPFYDGTLPCRQGRVQIQLGDRRLCQYDRLFRALSLIFMDPRALFTDICDLDHIRIQSRCRCRLAKRRFMHPRRA